MTSITSHLSRAIALIPTVAFAAFAFACGGDSPAEPDANSILDSSVEDANTDDSFSW